MCDECLDNHRRAFMRRRLRSCVFVQSGACTRLRRHRTGCFLCNGLQCSAVLIISPVKISQCLLFGSCTFIRTTLRVIWSTHLNLWCSDICAQHIPQQEKELLQRSVTHRDENSAHYTRSISEMHPHCHNTQYRFRSGPQLAANQYPFSLPYLNEKALTQ